MVSQFPSIQSFFPLNPSSLNSSSAKATSRSGDGFTSDEVDAVIRPSMYDWIPEREYAEVDIGALIPGPQCVTLTGRVANLYLQTNSSKKPLAAKGCVKLILKDDSGALTVRLWYANIDYKLRLGHLVSLWTIHISSGASASLSTPTAPLFVSMFPERDRTCHFIVHDRSDSGVLAKTPLGVKETVSLPGLMTLENFQKGGHEVPEAKILVCVKSIRARKRVTTKSGNPGELVNIHVFDDTADAILTLWGPTILSADSWTPSRTVLLISHPGCKIDSCINISLTASTHVDVDPSMKDADWLRNFAQRLTKRDHVNPLFPADVFDVEAVLESPLRPLYTFAEIDAFIRAAPSEIFMGYLSVVIIEVNISTLHMRKMLFCTECCGVPLYANSTACACKQCERVAELRINPRVVGRLIDETGSLAAGKLTWSATAWEQLLGRTPAQLAVSSPELLRYLEVRLPLIRVTLVFGCAAEEVAGGRLCVLGVKM